VNTINGNIANGGLAVKWRGNVIFARSNEWFLNADEEYIYYSNRDDENRLYKKTEVHDKGKIIVRKPCSGVTLFEDGIYYVNEEDQRVYRCSKEGKGVTACSKTETTEFAVLGDGAVYTNPNARRVCAFGGGVYFADGGNQDNLFALTFVDVRNGETSVFPDIKPSYINIHDDNVYYTDRGRENKIFRLDPSGSRMSVYGNSAECLHVLSDWLYFLADKKWKRLSLLNFGEAEEV